MPNPSFTRDDFTEALLGLLPRGRVWPKELGSVHAQAISCFAPTFQRISDTAVDLIADVFPASTNDLLTEWELTLGLPDACTVPGSQTFSERQKAVADKISAAGGPQRAYYIQMAAQLGVTVTIDEYQFLTVDNARTGDFLYGDGWPWGWLASAPSALYGSVNAAMLACRLQQEKPEYTDVVLGFGREVVDNIISQADSLFNVIHYVTPAAIAGIEDF
ncbi:putative phage tail protein [Pseudomonas gorinensis]